eukprot:6183299-Pleurochrysis_carterae.AAC.1
MAVAWDRVDILREILHEKQQQSLSKPKAAFGRGARDVGQQSFKRIVQQVLLLALKKPRPQVHKGYWLSPLLY